MARLEVQPGKAGRTAAVGIRPKRPRKLARPARRAMLPQKSESLIVA